MKKFLLLTSIAICISIITPHKLHAVDITVGAATWYTWWDFDQIQTDRDSRPAAWNLDADPAFLYGPALSVKFNDDLNLTFVYLYGKFDAEGISDTGVSTLPTVNARIKRSDSDLALNYRLNDYLKLFAGAKYMNFKYSISFPHNTYDIDISIKHTGIGPGLGLNATFPVVDNLFLLGTLSGFYLWGNEKEDYYAWERSPRDIAKSSKYKFKFKEYGFNSTLSLAYYITPASTVISLGGRFQYVKTDYKDSSVGNGTHKFYGLTLTATYSFGI